MLHALCLELLVFGLEHRLLGLGSLLFLLLATLHQLADWLRPHTEPTVSAMARSNALAARPHDWLARTPKSHFEKVRMTWFFGSSALKSRKKLALNSFAIFGTDSCGPSGATSAGKPERHGHRAHPPTTQMRAPTHEHRT